MILQKSFLLHIVINAENCFAGSYFSGTHYTFFRIVWLTESWKVQHLLLITYFETNLDVNMAGTWIEKLFYNHAQKIIKNQVNQIIMTVRGPHLMAHRCHLCPKGRAADEQMVNGGQTAMFHVHWQSSAQCDTFLATRRAAFKTGQMNAGILYFPSCTGTKMVTVGDLFAPC